MSDRETPAGPLSADVLRALVEQSLELIAITDGAGTITWANARFSAATGVSGGAAMPPARLRRRRARPAIRRARRSPPASPPARSRRRACACAPPTTRRSGSTRGPDARPSRCVWTFTDVSSTRVPRRAGAPPGRAARHGAGVRPPRRLGARHPVRRRPLGPPRVRLLGPRPGRRHAALRARRSSASIPTTAAKMIYAESTRARRPLLAALPRDPARRQDAPAPFAVGGEERPARRARPRRRHHDGRHRGLRAGARARRRQRAAQARGRPRPDRDLAPRPAHQPHALQRPRLPCSA